VDKLSIQNEMAQLDRKNRDFYDELTDEERKKFSNYLMLRWGSAVQGSRELQEYYVQSTNHYLNKHYFAINRHPKLQWLAATAISPGMGSQRHNWIAPKKKDSANSELRKTLMQIMPTAKMSDIEVLSQLIDRRELREYLRDNGSPDKD
jgi:hypothetical protein